MDKQTLIERLNADRASQRALERELAAQHDDGGSAGVGAQACALDKVSMPRPAMAGRSRA